MANLDVLFKGRKKEIDEFNKTWNQVINGKPSLLFLRGHPGFGKSSLIKEYFNQLTKNFDPENYWSGLEEELSKPLNIIPKLNSQNKKNSELPWVWLATRCKDSRTNEINIAFDSIRTQLFYQLSSILKKDKSNKLNKTVVRDTFSLLANFVIPGSTQLISILNSVINSVDGSLSLYDAYQSLNNKLKASKSTINSQEEYYENESKILVQKVIPVFDLVLSKKRISESRIPIIIVLDDAQWCDKYTILIINWLMEYGAKRGWPLLIVFSCWEETIELESSLSSNINVKNFYDYYSSIKNESQIIFVDQKLTSLRKNYLEDIIKSYVPKLGDKDLRILIKRSAGDIDLLKDFLNELIESPGWLNSKGELIVESNELLKLPSKAKEMANVRLKSIDSDVRKAIIWASTQGISFNTFLIDLLKNEWSIDIDIENSILQSDKKYGISKVEKNYILGLTGEFRRNVYYEACIDIIERHPKSFDIYKSILIAIEILVSTKDWTSITEPEKLKIKSLFIKLVQKLDLINDSYWNKLLLEFIQEIINYYIIKGNAFEIKYYAKLLLNLAPSIAIRDYAWYNLSRAAYILGDYHEEEVVLNSWSRENYKKTFQYYISKANFEMRSSNPKIAVKLSKKAIKKAQLDQEKFEANLSLAKANWSRGYPKKSFKLLSKLEVNFKETIKKNDKNKNDFDHISSHVLHDLEKNNQVAIHSADCIKFYQTKGDVYNSIIASVNYGDALWGLGKIEEAQKILETAYTKSKEFNIPHAIDISSICLANIYSTIEKKNEAYDLYQEGIRLANEINHEWDYLYGSIYSFLLESELNKQINNTSINSILKLINESNYKYLKELGNSIISLTSYNFNHENTINFQYSGEFPLPIIVSLSVKIIDSEILDDKQVNYFIKLLSKCEGIKLRRIIIFQAIEKIINNYKLNLFQVEFLNRWLERFSINIHSSHGYIECDYEVCEARCCYDGVYLTDEDIQKVNKAVNSDKKFFQHLPKDYIVLSEWDSKPGYKTNVRTYEYNSPDFPNHFNKTRCVFAFENGACSLQEFSIINDLDPWEFKPIACSIHPIRVKNGLSKNPTKLSEKDDNDIGLNYPGYSIFTPCGQERNNGKSYNKVFKKELTKVKDLYKN